MLNKIAKIKREGKMKWVGDSGYVSNELFNQMNEKFEEFLTPMRKNMKKIMTKKTT